MVAATLLLLGVMALAMLMHFGTHALLATRIEDSVFSLKWWDKVLNFREQAIYKMVYLGTAALFLFALVLLLVAFSMA